MTDHLTRRELLQRAAAGGSVLTLPGLLAACGGSSKSSSGSGSSNHKLAKTLHFSNWTLYMDTNKKKHTFPSLVEFQKKYGVHVDYVEELDKSAIPNMKNLVDVQKHPNFDQNRDYSLPWQSGMTGIAYNDTLTGPVLSIDDLLTNPKLKGKVTCLNSMGDALTLVMLSNGDDPSKVTDKSFNAAFNRIKKAVDSKQIRQFTGNDYAPILARGDLAAAMSWSGDIAQIGNKHLHWNVPKDGGALWTDNMLIPKGGNVYTASVYMYDPKVQGFMEAGDPKKEVTGIYYIPPVAGAGDFAKKYDPTVANNSLIF